MQTTPLSEQTRIILYGIKNTGKSSLMNNIFEKEVSIVSNTPGTTTDPVTRSIELGKLGQVALCDTAGFDDSGILGNLRIEKTISRFDTADIIIFVTRGDIAPIKEEADFLQNIKKIKKEIIIAVTFGDKKQDQRKKELIREFDAITINNINKNGVHALKEAIINFASTLEHEITPIQGLVNENDLVILVTPIDLAAPKGRLILPQVETIRDLLDKDCCCMIVKERELRYCYENLSIKPKLVITDSQVFSKVAADIPENQLLTSFSILFARKKGELQYFVKGIKEIRNTPSYSNILIIESCNHHIQADDIGSVKIPRLFRQLVHSKVAFDLTKTLPNEHELHKYFMTIHCAGCMITRNTMMKRINILKKNNIHGTNYGLFLAWANGLLPRALEPFPLEYKLFLNK